jgi:c-di-GMP-binding flagellar brake protein YcgR
MDELKRNEDVLEERRQSNRKTGSREQRNYIRTDISVPVMVYTQRKSDTGTISAKAWNISASGMMIKADAKLNIGIEADIDIAPAGIPNPIHCKGKVIWVSGARGTEGGYNYGIEFIYIEEDNKNTFLKFLCDTIYKSAKGR